jgi:hypothetical protein
VTTGAGRAVDIAKDRCHQLPSWLTLGRSIRSAELGDERW